MRMDSAGSPGLFIALQLSPIFGSISISIATNCDVKVTCFLVRTAGSGEPFISKDPIFMQMSLKMSANRCLCS